MIMEDKLQNSKETQEKKNISKINITHLANKIIEEAKASEEPNKPLKLKNMNFGRLMKMTANVDSDGSANNEIEFNEAEAKQMIRLQEIEYDIASGNLYTQEDYDRIYYESPLIKQLKKTETTEDLYNLAETIVGPQKKHI